MHITVVWLYNYVEKRWLLLFPNVNTQMFIDIRSIKQQQNVTISAVYLMFSFTVPLFSARFNFLYITLS